MPPQQPAQTPALFRKEGVAPSAEPGVFSPSPPAPSPPSPAAAVPLSDQALLDKVANLFRRIDRSRASLLPRELDAPKLMRELSEVLHGLEDKAATMTGESRANLQQVARELESGVKFMSQLNNFTAFVQLPVTVNGERATADLYVFNDSKDKRKIDPENATLFLSLATASAGRVETYVKVIGKNVECDFALETEQTAALVRREMPRLLHLLDAQGFRLQRTAATTQTEPAGVLEVKQRHDRRTSRYQFNALA
jgi:hypothetical protein